MILSCGRARPKPQPLSLEGAVARVGPTRVSRAAVARVAGAQGLSADRALEAVVDDELLAQGARRRGLDRSPGAVWAETAALAALTSARLLDSARSLGPPSDDELSQIVVVHAAVLRSPTLAPSDARALASRIEQSVAEAANADDFEQRARSVRSAAARIVVERVGPFGADGRTAEGASLDPSFVAAAFSLRAKGRTSPVICTHLGWHVIRLLDRVSPDPAGVEARRRNLATAVVELRARAAAQALLARRRARSSIELESGVDVLISSLAVQ